MCCVANLTDLSSDLAGPVRANFCLHRILWRIIVKLKWVLHVLYVNFTQNLWCPSYATTDKGDEYSYIPNDHRFMTL